MSVKPVASAVPKFVKPSQELFTQDQGPKYTRIQFNQHWHRENYTDRKNREQGNYVAYYFNAFKRCLTTTGYSFLTAYYDWHKGGKALRKEADSRSFSVLANKYAAEAATGEVTNRTTKDLFKRTLHLTGKVSQKDGKKALEIAKQLIEKELIAKNVPLKTRKKILQVFITNIRTAVVNKLSRTRQGLVNTAYFRKSRAVETNKFFGELVTRGLFSSIGELKKAASEACIQKIADATQSVNTGKPGTKSLATKTALSIAKKKEIIKQYHKTYEPNPVKVIKDVKIDWSGLTIID